MKTVAVRLSAASLSRPGSRRPQPHGARGASTRRLFLSAHGDRSRVMASPVTKLSAMAALALTPALALTACYPHTFVGAVTALPADCGPQASASGPSSAGGPSSALGAGLAGATVTA